MASLRDLQRSFAASLRDPTVECPVLPAANLAVYRNNAGITFRETLERTFPVVRRRVGDDYFRQLAALYRQRFPSRHGDLHWVGRDFGTFLQEHLGGGDYGWLADLAQLEWLRTESAVAAELPPLRVDALADVAAGELERLAFVLQPSLRLFASPFPVYSVWAANQVEIAPPVDQSLGSESGMTLQRHGYPEIRKLEPGVFSFIGALQAGASLGDAVATAALDEQSLTQALAQLFGDGLVISLAAGAPAEEQRVGTSS
jgi:hypothetical protein